MLNIGSRITELRKQKKWSQSELAKAVSASRDIIGKYERGDNLPSIEVTVKLAKAFAVSVDYLLGEGLNATYDKEMVNRMEEIEQLDHDTKQHLFFLIDSVIQNSKTKKAFSK